MAESELSMVVIAIDESEEAERAFDYYVNYIHRPGNQLLLVHSAEMPHVPSKQALLIDGNMWDEAVITQKAKVKQLEDKYSAKMLDNSIPGSIKAMFSNKPGELLVQTAQETKAIMIVTGSRGLGKMRRTILGSVSDYVLHHAHCPVFICRRELCDDG